MFLQQQKPVDVTDEVQTVLTEITEDVFFNCNVRYEYTSVPIISMTELSHEMFLPSDKNDAILEVDGMQLHVNKSFLSYHSDFFSTLFSSNFKEGQMEVHNLSKDCVSKWHHKSVPKLLELADRFMIPSVIHHVEYHLLHYTKIVNENLMWMADRYGMDLLLEKMINELENVARARKLKASSDYMKLSDKIKAKILDKVMTII
ncbi:Protein CBG07860 [Caenorhabditis briggsae]|uniref:Protein CBG07860 n=1 Tax=Caenorhabditis briggsae TaxID=6238 RepID=A8X5A5_CAEBR|nr:Protein CBG07860 [Caenorhabditis briggsae]CAP27804.2 Protein CBG07860 [Caenorhabditis briggsae]